MIHASAEDTVDLPGPSAHRFRPGGLSALVEVDLGGLSHPGRKRPNNEDHYLVARFDRGWRALLDNLPAGTLPPAQAETAYGMLVADGMGGQAAGEVASRTAIGVLIDLVLDTPDWIMRLDQHGSEAVLQRLDRRLAVIAQALTDRARAEPQLAGMGTTMTIACSHGADLLVAHVGDSRAYLFRQGQLRRLTRDQTLAQDLADSGAISQQAVARHPLRHVLTSGLATNAGRPNVELHQLGLADGDQVLLCSDGLTDMVADDSIADVLGQGRSAADACAELVERALQAGGKDNVTVVVGRYQLPAELAS